MYLHDILSPSPATPVPCCTLQYCAPRNSLNIFPSLSFVFHCYGWVKTTPEILISSSSPTTRSNTLIHRLLFQIDFTVPLTDIPLLMPALCSGRSHTALSPLALLQKPLCNQSQPKLPFGPDRQAHSLLLHHHGELPLHAAYEGDQT